MASLWVNCDCGWAFRVPDPTGSPYLTCPSCGYLYELERGPLLHLHARGESGKLSRKELGLVNKTKGQNSGL